MARKKKTGINHHFFLKNAAEPVLERFLEPPADAHQEKGAKGPFFLFPLAALLAHALSLKKRKATRKRARTSRGLVVFFLASAFLGCAAPGERKKRSIPQPAARP